MAKPVRITPGHGYLESLSADNVTVRTDRILGVVPHGIQMEDGTTFSVDAIVCATGFDTSFCPAFPVIGQDGEDLRTVWKDEPRSYLSVAACRFPNYFGKAFLSKPLFLHCCSRVISCSSSANSKQIVASGPNFPLANGTLIPCLERCISYAFEAADKIRREGIRSLSPKHKAVNDFQEHKDALMKDLVWTSGCRSWYVKILQCKIWRLQRQLI